MGVLTDDAAPSLARGGEGQKFVDLYWSLDEDDRALIRKWDEDKGKTTVYIHRKLSEKFDIGRSSVERGLERLRAASWEC